MFHNAYKQLRTVKPNVDSDIAGEKGKLVASAQSERKYLKVIFIFKKKQYDNRHGNCKLVERAMT